MEFGFQPRTLTDCLGIQRCMSVLCRISVCALEWFFTNIKVSCEFKASVLMVYNVLCQH